LGLGTGREEAGDDGGKLMRRWVKRFGDFLGDKGRRLGVRSVMRRWVGSFGDFLGDEDLSESRRFGVRSVGVDDDDDDDDDDNAVDKGRRLGVGGARGLGGEREGRGFRGDVFNALITDDGMLAALNNLHNSFFLSFEVFVFCVLYFLIIW